MLNPLCQNHNFSGQILAKFAGKKIMDDGLKNRHANIHEQNLIHIVDNDFLTDFIPFSGSMKQIPKL